MTGSHSWRRRGLPLLGGAVLLLSLAACGDDSTSSGATTVVSGGATTTAAASGGSTTTAAAAGGASTTAGSSAEWDKVVEAAKKEGKVTIYSSQGLDQLNDFAAKFKDEYGIPVEVVRGIDGDLLAKVEAEKQTGNGIADMWVSASQSTVEAKAKEGGWFLPAGGPSFDSPDYDKANYYKPGDYFEVGAAILTFGWNTQLVPKGLKDYTDLLDPELGGGKIGVIEPTAPSIVDFYLYLEENYGADFVQKLASQEPRIYPSSLPMGQALTSGEIAAGSFVQVQNDPKAKGAPVDSGLAPEAWGARFFGSLLATGPHPNAAQLLANFMLTPEGQEAVMHNASSVFPDIPGTVTSDDKVREQDLSKLTPETVKAYQEKWNSMFK